MIFLLDANIVSYFLQTAWEKELAAAAAVCPMAVVDEVYVELKNDKHRGGASFERWFADESGVDRKDIVVGSPVAATFAQLVGAGGKKDRGERASIAVAAHDPAMTFVTNDKNGSWMALREIWSPGDRLLGVAPFLRRLHHQGAITVPAVLDDVMALIPHQQPTWWAAWRGSIPEAKPES